jgi:hypothetical protein
MILRSCEWRTPFSCAALKIRSMLATVSFLLTLYLSVPGGHRAEQTPSGASALPALFSVKCHR